MAALMEPGSPDSVYSIKQQRLPGSPTANRVAKGKVVPAEPIITPFSPPRRVNEVAQGGESAVAAKLKRKKFVKSPPVTPDRASSAAADEGELSLLATTASNASASSTRADADTSVRSVRRGLAGGSARRGPRESVPADGAEYYRQEGAQQRGYVHPLFNNQSSAPPYATSFSKQPRHSMASVQTGRQSVMRPFSLSQSSGLAAQPLQNKQSPAGPSRFLLTVVPPEHLPHDPPHPRTSQACSGYGPPHHFRRGTLIPLYPTLSGQLAAISREYGLPSTGGLVLYLLSATDPTSLNQSALPGSAGLAGEGGPRIGEEAWALLWGQLFEPDEDELLLVAEASGSEDEDEDLYGGYYDDERGPPPVPSIPSHHRDSPGVRSAAADSKRDGRPDQSPASDGELESEELGLSSSDVNSGEADSMYSMTTADPDFRSTKGSNSQQSSRYENNQSPRNGGRGAQRMSQPAAMSSSTRSRSRSGNGGHRLANFSSTSYPNLRQMAGSRQSVFSVRSMQSQNPYGRSQQRRYPPAPPSAHSFATQAPVGGYGSTVIVGKVEFDIDRRRGGRSRWYEGWIEQASVINGRAAGAAASDMDKSYSHDSSESSPVVEPYPPMDMLRRASEPAVSVPPSARSFRSASPAFTTSSTPPLSQGDALSPREAGFRHSPLLHEVERTPGHMQELFLPRVLAGRRPSVPDSEQEVAEQHLDLAEGADDTELPSPPPIGVDAIRKSSIVSTTWGDSPGSKIGMRLRTASGRSRDIESMSTYDSMHFDDQVEDATPRLSGTEEVDEESSQEQTLEGYQPLGDDVPDIKVEQEKEHLVQRVAEATVADEATGLGISAAVAAPTPEGRIPTVITPLPEVQERVPGDETLDEAGLPPPQDDVADVAALLGDVRRRESNKKSSVDKLEVLRTPVDLASPIQLATPFQPVAAPSPRSPVLAQTVETTPVIAELSHRISQSTIDEAEAVVPRSASASPEMRRTSSPRPIVEEQTQTELAVPPRPARPESLDISTDIDDLERALDDLSPRLAQPPSPFSAMPPSPLSPPILSPPIVAEQERSVTPPTPRQRQRTESPLPPPTPKRSFDSVLASAGQQQQGGSPTSTFLPYARDSDRDSVASPPQPTYRSTLHVNTRMEKGLTAEQMAMAAMMKGFTEVPESPSSPVRPTRPERKDSVPSPSAQLREGSFQSQPVSPPPRKSSETASTFTPRSSSLRRPNDRTTSLGKLPPSPRSPSADSAPSSPLKDTRGVPPVPLAKSPVLDASAPAPFSLASSTATVVQPPTRGASSFGASRSLKGWNLTSKGQGGLKDSASSSHNSSRESLNVSKSSLELNVSTKSSDSDGSNPAAKSPLNAFFQKPAFKFWKDKSSNGGDASTSPTLPSPVPGSEAMERRPSLEVPPPNPTIRTSPPQPATASSPSANPPPPSLRQGHARQVSYPIEHSPPLIPAPDVRLPPTPNATASPALPALPDSSPEMSEGSTAVSPALSRNGLSPQPYERSSPLSNQSPASFHSQPARSPRSDAALLSRPESRESFLSAQTTMRSRENSVQESVVASPELPATDDQDTPSAHPTPVFANGHDGRSVSPRSDFLPATPELGQQQDERETVYPASAPATPAAWMNSLQSGQARFGRTKIPKYRLSSDDDLAGLLSQMKELEEDEVVEDDGKAKSIHSTVGSHGHGHRPSLDSVSRVSADARSPPPDILLSPVVEDREEHRPLRMLSTHDSADSLENFLDEMRA